MLTRYADGGKPSQIPRTAYSDDTLFQAGVNLELTNHSNGPSGGNDAQIASSTVGTVNLDLFGDDLIQLSFPLGKAPTSAVSYFYGWRRENDQFHTIFQAPTPPIVLTWKHNANAIGKPLEYNAVYYVKAYMTRDVIRTPSGSGLYIPVKTTETSSNHEIRVKTGPNSAVIQAEIDQQRIDAAAAIRAMEDAARQAQIASDEALANARAAEIARLTQAPPLLPAERHVEATPEVIPATPATPAPEIVTPTAVPAWIAALAAEGMEEYRNNVFRPIQELDLSELTRVSDTNSLTVTQVLSGVSTAASHIADSHFIPYESQSVAIATDVVIPMDMPDNVGDIPAPAGMFWHDDVIETYYFYLLVRPVMCELAEVAMLKPRDTNALLQMAETMVGSNDVKVTRGKVLLHIRDFQRYPAQQRLRIENALIGAPIGLTVEDMRILNALQKDGKISDNLASLHMAYTRDRDFVTNARDQLVSVLEKILAFPQCSSTTLRLDLLKLQRQLRDSDAELKTLNWAQLVSLIAKVGTDAFVIGDGLFACGKMSKMLSTIAAVTPISDQTTLDSTLLRLPQATQDEYSTLLEVFNDDLDLVVDTYYREGILEASTHVFRPIALTRDIFANELRRICENDPDSAEHLTNVFLSDLPEESPTRIAVSATILTLFGNNLPINIAYEKPIGTADHSRYATFLASFRKMPRRSDLMAYLHNTQNSDVTGSLTVPLVQNAFSTFNLSEDHINILAEKLTAIIGRVSKIRPIRSLMATNSSLGIFTVLAHELAAKMAPSAVGGLLGTITSAIKAKLPASVIQAISGLFQRFQGLDIFKHIVYAQILLASLHMIYTVFAAFRDRELFYHHADLQASYAAYTRIGASVNLAMSHAYPDEDFPHASIMYRRADDLFFTLAPESTIQGVFDYMLRKHSFVSQNTSELTDITKYRDGLSSMSAIYRAFLTATDTASLFVGYLALKTNNAVIRANIDASGRFVHGKYRLQRLADGAISIVGFSGESIGLFFKTAVITPVLGTNTVRNAVYIATGGLAAYFLLKGSK